jgi:predicted dehydrogenase
MTPVSPAEGASGAERPIPEPAPPGRAGEAAGQGREGDAGGLPWDPRPPGRTPLRVGVVGCGKIVDAYLTAEALYPPIRFVACADRVRERSEAVAGRYGLRALDVEELLADPEVDIVCNLTTPQAHAEVSLAALRAGHHVYQEKPLALDRESARRVLEAAVGGHRLVGSAPDTFLGVGLQTCRRLIDEGAIGEPVGAAMAMLCHGHESWHPDPAFYYQAGGGPLLDMGPYYLTALVSLLGPVARVGGMARASFPERVITAAPRAGERIRVEVPTHVVGSLELASGAIATLATSFDVWADQMAAFSIFGSDATLAVPDPNTFGGPVRLWDPAQRAWHDIPTDGSATQQRGVGLADLAIAAETGRAPRASGELAFHVLDTLLGLLEAAERGQTVTIESRVSRPAPWVPSSSAAAPPVRSASVDRV